MWSRSRKGSIGPCRRVSAAPPQMGPSGRLDALSLQQECQMIRGDLEATGAGSEEVVEPVLLDVGERFDSVYFFIWPGWRAQLESNRWHWGKRWGLRVPVVFVQPEMAAGVSWHAEPEGRLENVTLLSVETHSWDPALLFTIGLRQVGQISRYMAERGHTRPLFWLYNPFFAPAYLFLPAVAPVVHGSES